MHMGKRDSGHAFSLTVTATSPRDVSCGRPRFRSGNLEDVGRQAAVGSSSHRQVVSKMMVLVSISILDSRISPDREAILSLQLFVIPGLPASLC
jgi:hypothetical protein